MIVGEVGLAASLDHAAMLHVFGRLAGARDLFEMLAKHIPWWSSGAAPGRPWVRSLDVGCRRPRGFRGEWSGAPQHLCFAAVRRVRDYRAGALEDPCRGRGNQWRSRRAPRLQRAAQRRGWTRVGCGRRTLHVYWEIPR